MDLSPLAVWTRELAGLDPREVADLGGIIESLGYGGLWCPGGMGDPVDLLDVLDAALSGSTRLVAASGIINIFAAAPDRTAARAAMLWANHPDRFLLGIGVGHRESLQRGDDAQREASHHWAPVDALRAYLDQLDARGFGPTRRAIGALSPFMLRLAKDRSAGAHPYHVTPEHTAQARSLLGAGPLLVPEQAVVLETDPAAARRTAREHLGLYLQLGNYVRNWLSLGYTAEDVAGDGSDRLIDAVVAWGDDATVTARLRTHLDAGADQVAVQVLGTGGRPPVDSWRRISEAFT